MRDFSKVSPRFWTGDTGKALRALGPTVQVVAFYVFTCPGANALGMYYLSMPTLCHETGSPLRGASKALQTLSEVGFAYYDQPSETMFVPNMAREQLGPVIEPKDNRHKSLLRQLDTLRKAPYFNSFVILYREAYSLHSVVLAPESEQIIVSPSQGASKGLLGSPFSLSPSLSQSPSQSSEGAAEIFPDGLDPTTWKTWFDYRQQIRKPIKPASRDAAMAEMAKYGADQAAVVQQSIAHGWQGLFPLKTVANGAGKTHKTKFEQQQERLNGE